MQPAVRTATLSALVAFAAVVAAPALAQDAGSPAPAAPMPYIAPPPPNSQPDSGWNADDWRTQTGPTVSQLDRGVRALKSGNFQLAETSLTKALKTHTDDGLINFYMGVAQMGLGKWDAARAHLEIAYREDMTHPDPASRLGVAYARLGNTAGAQAQRTALLAMADECRGTCKLAPFIVSGIRMIDEALVDAATPRPASGMAVYGR
jgi:tetratricopeptide (TPR) repeat protein